MPSFGNVLGGQSGGQAAGAGAAMGYYDNAQRMYDPYRNGGLEDYNTLRGNVSDRGAMLDQYGNPADYQWKQGAMSQQDAYQQMMNGYQTSPQAMYQQEQMQKAADRGASASGMMGSGSYFDALQRNQQDIIAQDQQQWFQNMQSVGQQQMGQIQNFQGQQREYNDQLKYLTDLGYSATEAQSKIEQMKAEAAALQAQGESNGFGNMLGMAGGIVGGIYGGPIGASIGSSMGSSLGGGSSGGGGGMGGMAGGMGGFF